MSSSGNFFAGIPVGLQPGERRSSFKLFGGGQLDTVSAFGGKAASPHVLNEKWAMEKTLVLIFEPDGKVTVVRE
jgi:hypothetical protein